jgi:DNA primase
MEWSAPPMDFVDQVRNAVDIVTVIGQYVRLKRVGSTANYKGLCPFHTEKTPSFNVHSDKGFYYCFGCHVGGDMFKFVMQIEGLPFPAALNEIAERNGIPVPRRADYSDPDAKLRAALLEMHELAAGVFQTNLQGPAGGEARSYLAKRGLSEAQWKEFGLGLSDGGWEQLTRKLQERGYAPEVLEHSGLVMKRQEGSGFYDRFRGRLMFPIHNESGKIIAFGGRALRPADEPKYLNSPETALYKKSSVLYNLHRAKESIRKQDRSILVEGYMDVIGVWSAGVHEVVASCGTALTSGQVRSLKRHSERIVVNFDPDAAGANAAEKSIQILLDEGMHVRILELDDDLDPDEYIRKHGAEQYEKKLSASVPYFHWLADRARGKFDMRDVDGRMQAWKFLQPAIQRLPDKLERIAVVHDLAGYLGVDAAAILEQFRKNAGESAGRNGKTIADPASRVPAMEKLLLRALLDSAEARSAVLPRLERLPAVRQFVTWSILEALLAAAGQEPFRYGDLEARLNEADRHLLPRLLLADNTMGADQSLEQALACIQRLEAESGKRSIADLKTEIRAAERAGDFESAMRKAEELRRLERE